MGAIPGLVLVTGIALTGGAGLLVAGPMVAAMSALGLGSLAGGTHGGCYRRPPLLPGRTPNVEEGSGRCHRPWTVGDRRS